MRRSKRPLAIPTLALLAATIPFLLGSRDPIEDARDRLAAMTPAQRKAIEENREKYDRLSSFEQYELRELSNALAALPPTERVDLETTMGKLAAWVATFPDDVRSEYEKALPSGRRDILKRQLAEWKKRENLIGAEVAKADALAKRAEPQMVNPAMARKTYQDRIERAVRQNGTSEDKALLALVQDSDRLNQQDKMVVFSCLSAKIGLKPQMKGLIGRKDFPMEPVPIAILKSCSFVPAFARHASGSRNGTSDTDRRELAATVLQIYLLQPAKTSKSMEQALSRLEIPGDARPGPFQIPAYLLQQLAVLKDYHERNKSVPLADKDRVKKLLER